MYVYIYFGHAIRRNSASNLNHTRNMILLRMPTSKYRQVSVR